MLQLESAVSRYYFSVRDGERNRYISTAFWSIIILSTIWAIISIYLSDMIALLLFGDRSYGRIILVASFIIPLSNIFAFFTVLIRFMKQPIHYTFFIIFQLITTISVSILLVVVNKIGIIGVFIGQLSGYIVACILMLFYLRHQIKWIWDKEIIYNLCKYSLPLVPAVAGNWANNYINRIFMLSYLSLGQIGIYTVGLKFASVFKIIQSAFNMIWGPYFWETFEKNINHKNIFININKYVVYIIFLLVGLMSLASSSIVRILATESYKDASILIGLICLSTGLLIIQQTVGMGAAIREKTYLNTLIYFSSVLVNICSLFIFVPTLGILGVPISLLLSSITSITLAWYISERLYPMNMPIARFIISFIVVLIIVVYPLMHNI